MKTKSAILWALMLVGAGGASGCGGGAAVRGDWEADLRGALNLNCHNIDHLGYGLHYDIVLDSRQATTRESAGAPARPPYRVGSGEHGE